jgi:cholesterol oxidase
MKCSVDDADVVVVGSGFGGSIVTHILVKAGIDVLVLERGQKWDPKDFPRLPDDLFGNVWEPRRGRYGLYDIRSFKGCDALVSAGQGGGSLIYANVLLRKDEKWFTTPRRGGYVDWPITRADLEEHYDAVLGILHHERFPYAAEVAPRTAAFESAARARGYCVDRPELAVRFTDPRTKDPVPDAPFYLHGRRRATCRLCGECILGCQSGAKGSLDLEVLAPLLQAKRVCVSQGVVRTVAPLRDGCGHRYAVRYIDLSQRMGANGTGPGIIEATEPTKELHCNVLVLAAGALGSTEIMLRSRANFPGLSNRVGSAFSPNGDLLTFGTRIGRGPGRQHVPGELLPASGPTITTCITVDDPGGDGGGFYLQDAGMPRDFFWLLLGLPVPLRIAGLVGFGGRRILELLGGDPASRVGGRFSRALPRSRVARTLGVLGMGVDTADGRLALANDELQLSWTVRRSRKLLRQIAGASDDIIQELGGRTWPTTLMLLRRIITVHPVGGLPMGESRATGVVDSHGEVFADDNERFEGLFVVDGAVMPGAVGPNPALTIAAFAHRAGAQIKKRAAR